MKVNWSSNLRFNWINEDRRYLEPTALYSLLLMNLLLVYFFLLIFMFQYHLIWHCHCWQHVRNFNLIYCSLSQQEWGKIASLYLQHQWQVIQMALQSSTAPWWDTQTLLVATVDTLNVGLEETTIPVMGTLQCLLPKVCSLLFQITANFVTI